MILEFIETQKEWSLDTFGPGRRTEGVCKHIEKELQEVRDDPTNVDEWVDVVILALDGAWRAGHSPEAIVQALKSKQRRNLARAWPPISPEDEPVEHIQEAMK